MSDLLVIAFNNEADGFELRTELVKMQQEYLIELEDAVVVTRDADGKVKLHQAVNLTAAGAVGGGFWGTLVGLLFLNPLLARRSARPRARSRASSAMSASMTTSCAIWGTRSRRRLGGVHPCAQDDRRQGAGQAGKPAP